MVEYEVQRVDGEHLDRVRQLFAVDRGTRHCWCMAFCSSSRQFALGWYGGGNQRRFEALAATEFAPMGVLASVNSEPIGWCGCGPRSRYTSAMAGRSSLLADRPPEEDAHVWLVACVFVRPSHRGLGVVRTLVGEAVSLARERGASAIEGWPLAAGARRRDQAHVGAETIFAGLGFHCVQRPSAERAIMRLNLRDEDVP